MFGFGKKKSAAQSTQETQGTPCEPLAAPVTGQYKPLSSVADPVFAQGMMGEGYAVEPDESTIVAPVSGEIALLQSTCHAFMIRTADRAEVLVHVGIDTVELEGRGLSALAQVGQTVTAGQAVIKADWAAIRADIPSTEVMVMVTNSKQFGVSTQDENPRPVAAGQEVANLVKK